MRKARMRKAFLLVEMIVTITVIFLIAVPLARLTVMTFREIPKSHETILANTSTLNALEQIKKDVHNAKRFPESFKEYTSNDKSLLIELPDAMICYQLEDDRISRRNLLNEKLTKWPIPEVKVEWNVWRNKKDGYALEIKNRIEYKRGRVILKKMANTHLYFSGLHQEIMK